LPTAGSPSESWELRGDAPQPATSAIRITAGMSACRRNLVRRLICFPVLVISVRDDRSDARRAETGSGRLRWERHGSANEE
jgi:hypothetical protein